MTDDIVARLRVLNHHAKKLAENESLHDLHREAFTRCEDLTWQAATEINRLRADLHELQDRCGSLTGRNGNLEAEARNARDERDAARREICLILAARTDSDAISEIARSRGWGVL